VCRDGTLLPVAYVVTPLVTRGQLSGAVLVFRDMTMRKQQLAALITDSRTVVLFESPARIRATLADLLATCGPLRELAIARELTKLYEEVWRGNLADAVAHVNEVEPRGEHVIVLAPAPPSPEASDDEIDAHVAAALAEGMTARDAAARVAADLHVPRRRAYDAATRLRRK